MVYRNSLLLGNRTVLLNVDDPRLNLILNTCFWAIALLTVLSMVPWGYLERGRTIARWLPLPAVILFLIYERAMPSRMDIRVDLFLLAPMGLIIMITWGVRLLFGRGAGTR